MNAFHSAGKRQVWLTGLTKSLNVLIIFILLFSALGTQIASADGGNNVVDENQLDANIVSSNRDARLEFTRPSARTAEQNNLPGESVVNSPALVSDYGADLQCVQMALSGFPCPSNEIGPVWKGEITYESGAALSQYSYMKILCTGWGCSQRDIYYTTTVTYAWASRFGRTVYVSTKVAGQGGTAEGAVPSTPCGVGGAGSCTITASGVLRAPLVSTNPDANSHFYFYRGISGIGTGDLLVQKWTMEAALDPSLLTNYVEGESVHSDCCKVYKEGNMATYGVTQGIIGDPINTQTGGLDYPVEDLAIQTSVGQLSFQRSYSSKAVALYTAPLGYGWTHNLDTRLIFPTDPGGKAGYVYLKAHSANLYRFYVYGDGRFSPVTGVMGSLVRNPGPPVTYTLQTETQNTYLFNEAGKLLTWTDPKGHSLTYSYDANNRLDLITADGGSRYLDIGYDDQGRLATVTDHAARSVSFGYDASGDLVSAVDILGGTWQYVYGSKHELTDVIDPQGKTVVRTEYEESTAAPLDFNNLEITSFAVEDVNSTMAIEDDGATLHITGNGWKKVEVPYAITDKTILEFDFRSPAQGEVHGIGYDTDNTLSEQRTFKLYGTQTYGLTAFNNYAGSAPEWKHYRIPLGQYYSGDALYLFFANDHDVTAPTGQSYFSNVHLYEDNGLQAVRQYDGEDNLVVKITYNSDGTAILTDALGNEGVHTYDSRRTLIGEASPAGAITKTYDPHFRPATLTEPLGNTTSLTWSPDGVNLTNVMDAGNNQTDITYDALNNLTSIVDPLEHLTSFEYTGTLLTETTDALNKITSYTYTAEGLLETIIDAEGQVTRYEYNAYGEQIKTIENYVAGLPSNDQSLYNLTTLYGYDDLGRLVSVTDPLGQVTKNEYDAADRLVKVTRNYDPERPQSDYDVFNIVTTYTYDARGNQIAVTNTYNVITRTYFDDASRLVTMVQNLSGQTIEEPAPPYRGTGDIDQNVRTDTVYDDAGNAIASVDPVGLITRTYYDEANRPVTVVQNLLGATITDPEAPEFNPDYPDRNVRTDTVYNANGNVIATIDTYGKITRTYYDVLNRPVTVVQNLSGRSIENNTPPDRNSNSLAQTNLRTDMEYDANGNTIKVTDPLWVVTRTFYDELNRPIRVVQNFTGLNETYEQIACGMVSQDLCTDTYYDNVGRAIATVDPMGVVNRTYFDEAGRAVTVVQNLVGQDINVTTPPERGSGGPDENNRTDTTYDENGRRIASMDALGRVTRFEYDELGQLVFVIANNLEGEPQNYLDEYNLITTYTYDALGRQLSTTDTLGRKATTEYDHLGRVVSNTQNVLDGQPQNHQNEYNITTSYAYDRQGSQIAVTDPLEMKYRTYYDTLGRTTSLVRNLNGQAVENMTPPVRGGTETNLRADTSYGGDGRVTSTVDELNFASLYAYDDLGRQVGATDPLDHTTQSSYDAVGRLVSVTDAEGVVTKFEYDALGRLTAVIENFQSSAQPDNETNVRTEYTYDANGNRLTIMDGNGHATTFNYDDLGRLVTERDALDHAWHYYYDKAGNRVSLLDANGNTISYNYDTLNRLKMIDYPSPDADVTFTYDAGSRRLRMLDGLGTTTWSYDSLDRPISTTDPFGQTVGYSYDALGNRASLTYPDSKIVTYEYDSAHRLNSVNANQTSLAGYLYDASSRVKTITLANGVTTTYDYDAAGRLVDIEHNKDGETIASYQYNQYDAVGNRTQVIEDVRQPLLAPTPTATPTNDVVVTVLDTDSAPKAGLPVYAFNGSTYTNYSKATDVNGQAVFTLPSGSYRFRADYNGTQFWSGTSNHCDVPGCTSASVIVTIPLTVTVLDTDGTPRAGLPVYAFNGSTYTNYSKTTDANGQAVFTLPLGSYRFRADYNGTQFWSGTSNHCDVPGCTSTSVTVTIPLTVTVLDTDGTPKTGLPVYAFNGSTYTNYSKTTDANGQAVFTLPLGSYRYRADYNGTQFWSGTSNHCYVPGCTSASVIVTIPLTVTVLDTDGTPRAGLPVYAFNGSTYTNYSKTTDANGQAVFTLPLGSYRFRADYNGTQFWSGTSNHCDVPGCTSTSVTVTNGVLVTVLDSNGAPKAGLKVYVFNGTTYTGFSATTNTSGQAVFTLPSSSYHFRADYYGTQFWSGTSNHCDVPGCTSTSVTVTIPLTVTVLDTDGTPKTGLPVYAFNGSTYTNYSKTTDVNGQAVFTLPSGSYRFRADYNGTQFWSGTSNHCYVPGCTSASVIVTIPLTVTVLDTDGTPRAGLPVYAFNGSTYTNYSKTTDANGQAVFTLPLGSYRYRADLNGTQFWSGTSNHCTVPGCLSVAITVPAPTATSTFTATATSTDTPTPTEIPTDTPVPAPTETPIPTATQIGMQHNKVLFALVRAPLPENRLIVQAAPLQQGLTETPTPTPIVDLPIQRVSVDSNGTQSNDNSYFPSVSGDGRYVAFRSNASNLVPNDNNNLMDVFVWDRQSGAVERVNVDSSGVEANGESTDATVISADGRFVAFRSSASNLVPNDTNNAFDIFVHDLQTGITERLSVDSNGNEGNAGSQIFQLSLSQDGRYMVFKSDATNLVPGDTNNTADVFLRDRQAGTTERISVDENGNEANGENGGAVISADGRYVAFLSDASNLVPNDTNNNRDIFVRDRQTGLVQRVSVDSNGNQSNDYSAGPAISDDGRFVAFRSIASNLVPDDTNNADDVFIFDRQTSQIERVSVTENGAEGNNSSLVASLSSDGRLVTFMSSASNFVPGDTNNLPDIFLVDHQTDQIRRISVSSDGAEANGSSSIPVISKDGRFVAFESLASNLVTNDTNNVNDIFLVDGNIEIPIPTETPTPTPSVTPTPPPSNEPLTITYTYDPLYRLTAADYSDGTFFHYMYDKVGNRLSETTQLGTTTYTYDDANRLTSVGGVTYTYDNNGNLLSDGVNTYTYDSANRLITIQNQQSTIQYRYNGLGDRLQETVDGVTTTFVMDLSSGLTQVLNDGTYDYIYGNGRIAQVNGSAPTFFLTDALGSVRQLTDEAGEVTFAQAYAPYGTVTSSSGGASTYGFTNEYQSQGKIYLRARHYLPSLGRFLTRDTWDGDANRPMSFNRWNYTEGNPINYTDPSGHDPWWCEYTKDPAKCIMDWIKAYDPSTKISSSSYCPPVPSLTPTPADYVEPWKKYPDYDPASNSIPADKWPDTNAWDIKRSELVWGWLGKAQGMEWKYNDAKELAKWLVAEEIGVALRDTKGDNVWRDGNGETAFVKVLGYMKGLFSDGISSGDLGKFTAFFNPDGLKPFSQTDWNALMKAPPKVPYGNTVDNYWDKVGMIYTTVHTCMPNEIGIVCNKDIIVKSPLTQADLLYIDY